MNEKLQAACRAVIEAQHILQDIEAQTPPTDVDGATEIHVAIVGAERGFVVTVNDARRLLYAARGLAAYRLAEARSNLQSELG